MICVAGLESIREIKHHPTLKGIRKRRRWERWPHDHLSRLVCLRHLQSCYNVTVSVLSRIKYGSKDSLYYVGSIGQTQETHCLIPFFRSKVQWDNHQINTRSLAPVNCNMNKSAPGQSPFIAIMQHSSPKKEDYHPGGGGGTLQGFMQGGCPRGSTGLTRLYTIFGTTTINSACDIRGLFRHFRVS